MLKTENPSYSRELRAFADSNYVAEAVVRDDDYSLFDQVKALEKRLKGVEKYR